LFFFNLEIGEDPKEKMSRFHVYSVDKEGRRNMLLENVKRE
jgi:hypothetical protein